MYIDPKRLLKVLRLAMAAAYHACDHPESVIEREAKRGCGACRAVVALDELRDEAFQALGDEARPLLKVMEERDGYAEDENP